MPREKLPSPSSARTDGDVASKYQRRLKISSGYTLELRRVKDAKDVSETIKWAGKHSIDLTIAGGRHTIHSTEDHPSPTFKEAPGSVTSTGACSVYGVAVPSGTNADTGVGGYTVGGGYGYLSRHKGMTVDNLLEVEAVLANGDIVIASETQNSGLLWAIQGAGANFAVIIQVLILSGVADDDEFAIALTWATKTDALLRPYRARGVRE
ncbi:hypothetical protein M427DRAFT_35031 [Gonapodya prolifera JEL478]|uniref:FAD linked oxidase N-terminal domain-containing protein n=1 Tax=Gonapodya prolifera (strain JEL478) TaxID=1344416 RepID=A0A139A6S3_GONPJ|nr:hypothetical protein M427DRAFT_35031 [Gonapodya prolifera JEL478]|eukprot:KXS12145.1 hypothetical protein M427DRAFT_35031 [Gonapodya prolifera JEL478]